MQDQPATERQAVLRPLESLLRKSEKARGKLAEGTWQHAMLTDNVRALRLALALLTGEAGEAGDGAPVPRAALTQALAALDELMRRSEKAQLSFAAGTAQHTLQRNRIAALRAAQARVAQTLADRER